jgi:hypothetical protein
MKQLIIGCVLAVAILAGMCSPAAASPFYPWGYYRHPYCNCPYEGYYQQHRVYFRPGPYARPFISTPWGWGNGPAAGMGLGVY